jgi:hypothetical protein
MANREHFALIKRGVDVWNDWRDKNFDIRPDLSGADLSGEKLVYASFVKADLSNSNLSGADLVGTNFRFADLQNANLTGAELGGAELNSCNLSGARLDRAKLQATELRGSNLTTASLVEADPGGADLSDSDLTDADFTRAEIGFTRFGDQDLSVVRNLESVSHYGPSTLDIPTIYRSKGNIPEVFLRGAGVPENLITYMSSLTGKAFEFYSCFISFTEVDDVFSERLYNDLQGTGVRCWRWKEDAKWGKALMHSIDEAVRAYDKLVVICSEDSLNSPAVIREIERALRKEDELARQGRNGEVLFPIRLDDFIINGWTHHRQADVTAKNIGDFRQWKEPENYRKALNRLIRDLQQERND